MSHSHSCSHSLVLKTCSLIKLHSKKYGYECERLIFVLTKSECKYEFE